MPQMDTASNHNKSEQLAELLSDVRRDVRQIDSLPKDLVPDTIAAGHLVNEAVARRLGSDVMGDPLAPKPWPLEERCCRNDGFGAGETVSTGSMTGMLLVRAGQHTRARFGDEAEVEISFEA